MSAVGSSSSSKPSAGSHVTVALLRDAYRECTKKNGFRSFTAQVRAPNGQYSVKLKKIESLFKNATTWTKQPAETGHLKFKNLITGYVFEFAAHIGGGKKNNVIDPNAALSALETLQKHINLLGDHIFQFHKDGKESKKWKVEPDFQASLTQYRALRADPKQWDALFEDPYKK